MDSPLVSISCIVYNHAPYIRQCLDGFILQKNDFPFEILIHDDASTDETANIIREYEAKYPDIIKPIYQTENQYSRGVRGIAAKFNFTRAKGKYIALCEGDDYWTDPYKLQKQVDFLEANEDFMICFHSVKVKREKEGDMVDDSLRDVSDVTDIYELARGNYIHTPSVVFRKKKEVLDIFCSYKFPFGDLPLYLICARYGKIKKMADVMAVYRKHDRGMSNYLTMEMSIQLLEQLLVIFSTDEQLTTIFKQQFFKQVLSLSDSFKQTERELYQIRNSNSYKLGKLILKPFCFLQVEFLYVYFFQ